MKIYNNFDKYTNYFLFLIFNKNLALDRQYDPVKHEDEFDKINKLFCCFETCAM